MPLARRLPFALVALFAAVVFLAAGPGGPQEPKPQDPPKMGLPPAGPKPETMAELKKLAWLSGTWAFEKDGVTTEEHWRPLQGSTLLGTSHTFTDTKTVFFEFLRITVMRGAIAYIAMPGGAAPTVFPMVKSEEGVVVFENGKHDHPQRIRYEKTEKGMTATISMLDGSRAESFVFTKK